MCDLGGVIGLAKLRINLGRNIAFKERLEPVQRVGTCRIIGRKDECVFETRNICIGAAAIVQAVILPRSSG